MKKFISFLTAVFCLWVVSPLMAASKEDVHTVINYLSNLDVEVKRDGKLPIEFKTAIEYENKLEHCEFRYEYDKHSYKVGRPAGTKKFTQIQFRVKKYKYSATGERCYDFWIIADFDADGTPEWSHRAFKIYDENGDGIAIAYPEGFVNTDWYNPSKEEVQKMFDNEINFWLGFIKNPVKSCIEDLPY